MFSCSFRYFAILLKARKSLNVPSSSAPGGMSLRKSANICSAKLYPGRSYSGSRENGSYDLPLAPSLNLAVPANSRQSYSFSSERRPAIGVRVSGGSLLSV